MSKTINGGQLYHSIRNGFDFFTENYKYVNPTCCMINHLHTVNFKLG